MGSNFLDMEMYEKMNEENPLEFKQDAIMKEFGVKEAQAKKYYQLVAALEKQTGADNLKRQLADANLSVTKREQLEKEYAEKYKNAQIKAAKAVQNYEVNVLKNGTAAQKKELAEQQKNYLQSRSKQIDEAYQQELLMAQALGKDTTAIEEKYAQDKIKIQKELSDAKIAGYEAAIDKAHEETAGLKQAAADLKNDFSFKNGVKFIQEFDTKALEGTLDDARKASSAEIDEIQAQLDNADELGLSEADIQDLELQKQAAVTRNNQLQAQYATVKAVNQLGEDYKKAFSAAEDFLTKNSANLNTRLQGSGESFNKLTDKITSTLSVSPFVKVTDVLDEMKSAVEQGIVFNLEQRSFLAGVSDKIAQTFEVFDNNLLRLIKLQQADSTVARMGMESALNKYLNSTFEDSSYLNRLSDDVSGAILDASSQLNRNQSAEFEYTVQKWLGSLSSVGLSDSTVQDIAKGINLLGTGNVQALASDNKLQTMFAMAASEAGLEYSDILLNGLDSSTTNRLLEGMTVYLKQIAEGADNQVVKAAYGDILNLSVSDMKAISNLSQGDISNIYSQNLSYGRMMAETQMQLSTLALRTTLPEMLHNVYNNAIYGVASDMANNPVTWAMTKMLDYMEGNNIDINIPFINAAGFGLDLNASVVDLMKMGVGIGQGLSLATNLLQGLGSKGGTDLGVWDAKEYMSRGSSGGIGLTSTFGSTSSAQAYVLNTNQSDIRNSTLNTATDDAEETKKITNKNQPEATKTLDDLFKAVVGKPASDFIVSRDINIAKAYLEKFGAINVIDQQLLRINSTGSTGLEYLAVYDPVTNNSIKTIFGENSLIVNRNAVKVHSSELNQVINDKRGLRVYQDEISNSIVTVNSNSETPIYVQVVAASNLKTQLDGLSVNIANTDELSKSIASAIGVDDNENLPDKIADAIEEKELTIKSKDITSGLGVTVLNMPRGYIT